MTRRRVIASNVTGPTKRVADARHDGDDVVAALLQAARDLDRLVGADAAGDAEGDQSISSIRLPDSARLRLRSSDLLHRPS